MNDTKLTVIAALDQIYLSHPYFYCPNPFRIRDEDFRVWTRHVIDTLSDLEGLSCIDSSDIAVVRKEIIELFRYTNHIQSDFEYVSFHYIKLIHQIRLKIYDLLEKLKS